MDDEESGGGAQPYSRNAAFGEGMTGGQAMVSSHLAQEAERFKAMVPRGMMPSTSGNGMSSGQYGETMGGTLPVQNGMASNQYETAKFSMQRSA